MRALVITPGSTDIQLVDRPEPNVASPNQVKMKVLQVGICGTDREEAAGGRADAPPGEKQLVIGHEMFGQVVKIGSAVVGFKVGDYGVFMVRRPCAGCPSCNAGRADMCCTGNYTERGIKGRDGFQAQMVVDEARFLVKVPKAVAHLGVLTEPASVGEKAIDEACRIQAARLPGEKAADYLKGKRALVVGLGPIGLLGAMILRLRGATVVGMDIVDEGSPRPTLLKKMGGSYVDGRQVKTLDLDDKLGQIDLIFEATGVAQLEFDLIDALGVNGIYLLTGIPAGDRPVTMQPGALMQQMVLKNQVLVGSVNASHAHFVQAVRDLAAADKLWPEVTRNLITDRHPYTDFAAALAHHGPDEIKCVLAWS
jgi:threonine dehydrogenase-like Zn-dependent dehydrogenase